MADNFQLLSLVLYCNLDCSVTSVNFCTLLDLVILTTGLLEHFLEALELIEWDMLSQSSEIAGEIHCLATLLLLLLVEAT